ncbi:hypothetical protein PCG10_004534, partial [Penicillium crustosum]
INSRLEKKYNSQCNNWESCNTRTLLNLRKTLGVEATSVVVQIIDAREVYRKLRKTYTGSSHQQSYTCFAKWVDLRYKSGSASDFNLRINEKESNWMDKVYIEFIETEIYNRLVNASLYTANSTSSSSNKDNSSNNFNNKKKDDKKGNNDKSRGQSRNKDSNDSSSKDKKQKKQPFEREENVIFCKFHNTL